MHFHLSHASNQVCVDRDHDVVFLFQACYDTLKDLLLQNIAIIAGVAIGVAVIEVSIRNMTESVGQSTSKQEALGSNPSQRSCALAGGQGTFSPLPSPSESERIKYKPLLLLLSSCSLANYYCNIWGKYIVLHPDSENISNKQHSSQKFPK